MKGGMGKLTLAFLCIFVVSAVVLWVLQRSPRAATIIVGDQTLDVLVATTPVQQYRGLGGRSSLAPYDGMLFPSFSRQYLTVVMRDMEFSIDIIWADNGEIVDIAPAVPLEPGTPDDELFQYRPRVPASAFLEVPAGWAAAHDIRIGDRFTQL